MRKIIAVFIFLTLFIISFIINIFMQLALVIPCAWAVSIQDLKEFAQKTKTNAKQKRDANESNKNAI